ncbi:hypothetical protein IWQ61_007851 [Dispira simplex]|nr:hypothetical protein IWQ61_007851 [Dispira simplex]
MARLLVSQIILPTLLAGLVYTVYHLNWPLLFLHFRSGVLQYNTEQCTTLGIPEACEDIVIHHDSQTAFTACGLTDYRAKWFPPSAVRKEFVRESDLVYKVNLKTCEYHPLKLANFTGIYRAHGLGIYAEPNQSSKTTDTVTLMLVNHILPNSVVEIFDHKLGSDELVHALTVTDPLINTPNSVAPIGPRSFYVTNDFHYQDKPLRTVEMLWSAAWSGVALYDHASRPHQPMVWAYHGIPYPNGIDVDLERRLVVVGSSTGRSVEYFKINTGTLKLLPWFSVNGLPMAVDNIRLDTTTQDVYTAGDSPLRLVNSIAWVAVRLPFPRLAEEQQQSQSYFTLNYNDIPHEVLASHPGSWLGFVSVAAYDRANHHLLLGAPFYPGIGVCPYTRKEAT